MALLKSWLNRLRTVTGNRRLKPRFKPRPGPPLVASIAMLAQEGERIAAHVRDLSESGISFFMLGSRWAQRDLLVKGAKCRVILALPGGTIYLYGELVWCQYADPDKPEQGGVMAVRITEIKQDAKGRYLAYLSTLGERQ